MFKVDALAISFAAIASVGIELLPKAVLHEIGPATFVRGGLELAFLGLWTIGAMPLAFMMPRLRAGFFGRIWKVPFNTYLLPRWMVGLSIGVMLGQLIGVLILAISTDFRMFWLASSFSLIAAVFCAGAWQRLNTHPATEFSMPWWPRNWRR